MRKLSQRRLCWQLRARDDSLPLERPAIADAARLCNELQLRRQRPVRLPPHPSAAEVVGCEHADLGLGSGSGLGLGLGLAAEVVGCEHADRVEAAGERGAMHVVVELERRVQRERALVDLGDADAEEVRRRLRLADVSLDLVRLMRRSN